MTKIERPPEQLVLQSGSTTLKLDKNTNKATMLRKLLFWARKPLECLLSDIAEVRVDTAVDPASRAEICSTMLVMHAGGAWRLSASDKKDAETTVSAIRDFLGIGSKH
jgi:hypothetical protein